MGRADPRRLIEVIGHGGAGGYHPGNSRPAIELALALRVDRIECDVQRAADGDLVLVHDDELRLPDGRTRPLRALTTGQLRDLLPGLLTLDEAAELVAGRAPLLIDVKGPGYEPELIAAIRRHRLDAASSVSCTYASTLLRIRRAFPAIRTGLSTGHWAVGAPTRAIRAIARCTLKFAAPAPLIVALRLTRATDAMLQHRIATAPLVAVLHAGGWRVNVWTVDHPGAVRRALRLGVDGIISDRPDLVREIIAEERGRDDGR